MNNLLTALFLVVSVFGTAHAREIIAARVVSVIDGDTLVIHIDGDPVHIRLTEIDSPEKDQPYGKGAKRSLAELCLHKNAVIAVYGLDRYHRTLGHVMCGDVNANNEQVRRGMAWVYDQYVRDDAIYAAQLEAQRAHRGLWADVDAVKPSKWRSTHPAKSQAKPSRRTQWVKN